LSFHALRHFVPCLQNLRAATYGIAPADRLRTKLVAGKIVPAIATTTAAVSGLVALELIKIARGGELSDYKNAFLNLALPFMILTEPAEPAKEPLIDDRTWTLWDKWEVTGAGKETTLADFIASVKEKYGLTPVSVINGASIVYMSVMPAHQKRLTKSYVPTRPCICAHAALFPASSALFSPGPAFWSLYRVLARTRLYTHTQEHTNSQRMFPVSRNIWLQLLEQKPCH